MVGINWLFHPNSGERNLVVSRLPLVDGSFTGVGIFFWNGRSKRAVFTGRLDGIFWGFGFLNASKSRAEVVCFNMFFGKSYPLCGEMMQFDEHIFSNGLKLPPRNAAYVDFQVPCWILTSVGYSPPDPPSLSFQHRQRWSNRCKRKDFVFRERVLVGTVNGQKMVQTASWYFENALNYTDD